MNPVRGGRPPNERRISGTIAVSTGVLAHIIVRELIEVALFILNVVNAAAVITKYVNKARSEREGQN